MPINDLHTVDDPLSSAQLRYTVRLPAVSPAPGPDETRPYGMRSARLVPTPVLRAFVYCHAQQVAVDEHGCPLIDGKSKEWETKSSTDGDEGPEETWGWEEQ